MYGLQDLKGLSIKYATSLDFSNYYQPIRLCYLQKWGCDLLQNMVKTKPLQR